VHPWEERVVSRLLVAVVLIALVGPPLVLANECEGLAENRWWPVKGGIAIIRDRIYVGAGATKTNLIVIEDQHHEGTQRRSEVRWTGKSADEPEVVVVFQRQVLDWASLPKGFDLGMAIIVSFEPDKVRVFDFAKGKGGYYPRSK
jgi:hypothetical protein